MARAVVALVGLLLVAGCQVSQPAATSSPVPSGRVIPWLPLTPNFSPPSPSPGPQYIPANTRACQAQDLAVVVTGSGGATGHWFTNFGFAGITGECYLDGTPRRLSWWMPRATRSYRHRRPELRGRRGVRPADRAAPWRFAALAERHAAHP